LTIRYWENQIRTIIKTRINKGNKQQTTQTLATRRGERERRMEGSKQISQDLNYTHTRHPQIIQKTQFQAIIANPQKTQ
jgi:hypothetical protein